MISVRATSNLSPSHLFQRIEQLTLLAFLAINHYAVLYLSLPNGFPVAASAQRIQRPTCLAHQQIVAMLVSLWTVLGVKSSGWFGFLPGNQTQAVVLRASEPTREAQTHQTITPICVTTIIQEPYFYNRLWVLTLTQTQTLFQHDDALVHKEAP